MKAFKTIIWCSAVIGMLGLLMPCVAVDPVTLRIPSHVVAGGGGTSTNSQYSISGTIGQPDAGALTGGNFVLEGGFWCTAIQTAGAPWLTLLRTTTNTVAITWANVDPGWRLQWKAELQTNNVWIEVAPPYGTSGSNCLHVHPSTSGNGFFRLQKP